MKITDLLVKELHNESKATRAVLERIPADQLDWTPHPKSTPLGQLAWHLATIPSRVADTLEAGFFDLDKARPPLPEGVDFVAAYDRSVVQVTPILEAIENEAAFIPLPLVRGGTQLSKPPRFFFIRSVLFNHSFHHRGQLTVYLRLLNVPVPATYGTSADE